MSRQQQLLVSVCIASLFSMSPSRSIAGAPAPDTGYPAAITPATSMQAASPPATTNQTATDPTTIAPGAPYTPPPDASESISASATLNPAERLKKAADDALSMGNYASAESLYNNALKVLPRSTPGTESALRGGLAEACLWQGKLKDASREMNKALSLANKAYGAQSPEAACELDNLAWLSQAENRPDKAMEYCRQALAIRQQTLKANAPDLAESLEHMGWLAEKQDLFDEAGNYYRQALAIRQSTLGDNSVEAADDMERLAITTRALGNTAAAYPLFAQALKIKESTGAVFLPYAPGPVDSRVVYRFSQGAPNCQTESTEGAWAQQITANGVTVAASFTSKPSAFVKTTRAHIQITNQSARNISFLSQPPTMMVLRPKVKPAAYLSADQLAQTIMEKGERKATKIWRSGEDATTPVTSTIVNSGPYWGGGYAPFGRVPSGWVNPGYWGGGGGVSTVTTNVPDYAARAQAAQQSAQVSNQSQSEAAETLRDALGPTTVAPGSTIQGSLNFDQCGFDRALLRVPIGNAVFEFHYDAKKPW